MSIYALARESAELKPRLTVLAKRVLVPRLVPSASLSDWSGGRGAKALA